jgi:prevent-host-death family protein
MKTVEIVELRDNINEVLSEVEQGETVAVANNGRVIARLVPARRRRRSQREIDEIIAEMDRVADELSARWPAGVTALDAIDDVRS